VLLEDEEPTVSGIRSDGNGAIEARRNDAEPDPRRCLRRARDQQRGRHDERRQQQRVDETSHAASAYEQNRGR
jgi:hypothetical protein